MPDRDYWRLLTESAIVLSDLRGLLSHPCLDLAPVVRERMEMDCHALACLLPSRIREQAEVTPYDGPDVGSLPYATPCEDSAPF